MHHLLKQRRPLSRVLIVSGSMEYRSAQHIGLPHPVGAAPPSSSRYADFWRNSPRGENHQQGLERKYASQFAPNGGTERDASDGISHNVAAFASHSFANHTR